MLNILMIGGVVPWHPRAGGGQKYAYRLAKSIIRLGHNVDYVSIIPEGYDAKSREFIRLKAGTIHSQVFRSLGKVLKNYDIVHLHIASELLGCCIGYSLRKLLKGDFKFIVQIHSAAVHRVPRSHCELFSIFSCKFADLIISVSKFSQQNISKSYGIPKSKIRVAYAGVEEPFLKAEIKNRVEAVPTLLFVGRLGGPREQKGADILLRALPSVLTEQNVKLKMVGPGKVGPYLSLANKLNVGKNVEFIGFVSDSKLLEHYLTSDIFVLPSRRESFGLVLAEAMATGLPVVSTRVGAIPEVVEDGETGILVPPNNPEKFAEAVNSLLNNPKKMKLMGLRGRERVRKYFTWEKVAKRMLGYYNEIV